MRIWQRRYYTLYSSLPALPHFHKANVLPISRERLEARLRMLTEEDAKVVEQMWNYFAYERQTMARTDQEMIVFYHNMFREVTEPTLRAIIDFGMNQRTIVAGFRRRQRGLPAARPSLAWGVGPWVGHIERHWSDVDFNLTSVFPWIVEVRHFLESHETLALEWKLKDLTWKYLDRLADGQHFTFDAVLVYLVQWSLVNQWLLHDERKATARFESLAAEMIVGHDHLFA